MRKTKVEICCGSADDVFEAAAAGADRVELNAALFLGGLTPSIGEVLEAKKAGIEIVAMVRPREGGFCYSPREFETMLADARALLDAGAATIRQMVGYAAGRMEILPGAGIRTHNIREILEKTGCTQAHLSMRRFCADTSCEAYPEIHFGGALYASETTFSVTDANKVRELLGQLN